MKTVIATNTLVKQQLVNKINGCVQKSVPPDSMCFKSARVKKYNEHYQNIWTLDNIARIALVAVRTTPKILNM